MPETELVQIANMVLVQTANMVGSINGLIILSSAILAIIQFSVSASNRLFERRQNEIGSISLPSKEELKCSGYSQLTASLKESKELQDSLLSLEPDSPTWHIRMLLFLLPAYAFMHFGLHVCPTPLSWLPFLIQFVAFIVFILSIAMLHWIYKISGQRDNLKQKHHDFIMMSSSVASINCDEKRKKKKKEKNGE